MTSAKDVALYLLHHDKTGKLHDKTVVARNNRSFYAGNACLNKYLHIAQNLYLAKTGHRLFEDDLYAYDNGAVVPEVQEKYGALLRAPYNASLSLDESEFLDKVILLLEDATLDELIEISHEDDEWIDRHAFYRKPDQRMISEQRIDAYREQYADALALMEGMCV